MRDLGVPVSHPLRILRLVLLSDGMYAESHSHHATVHLRACQVGGLITFNNSFVLVSVHAPRNTATARTATTAKCTILPALDRLTVSRVTCLPARANPPQAYQKKAYYPTTYSIRFDEQAKEYVIAVGGMTMREPS